MDIDISTMLKEYGLDEREISAYIDLVANKELTAYRLAKNIRANRSTTYDVLERLMTKGFVSRLEKHKILYYQANSMSRVAASLKSKEAILESLAPRLAAIEKNIIPGIEVYSGIEGQKQFSFELYNLARSNKIKFAYMMGNTYASSISSNIFIERLVKEVSKRKRVEYRGIWHSRYRKDIIIKLYDNLGENRFLENIPSSCGTMICDSFVAFLYTADVPYIIVIRNRIIASELKAYFELLWKMSSNDV